MATPTGGLVSATLDQKSYDRAMKRLAKYEGKTLERRAKAAYLEAARMGVRAIRASGRFKSRSGNLRASVGAWSPRLRPGEMAVSAVGPHGRKGAHRHLIIGGHRIVTRGGRDTGQRTQPDPFVDEGFRAFGDAAQRFIRDRVLDIGGTFSPF